MDTGEIVGRGATSASSASDAASALGRAVSLSTTGRFNPYEWAEMSGMLVKQGERFKNWKPRFFRLVELSLYYYEKDTDDTPIGCVALEGCEIRHSLKSSAGWTKSIEIHHDFRRTFFMYSEEAAAKTIVAHWKEAMDHNISLRRRFGDLLLEVNQVRREVTQLQETVERVVGERDQFKAAAIQAAQDRELQFRRSIAPSSGGPTTSASISARMSPSLSPMAERGAASAAALQLGKPKFDKMVVRVEDVSSNLTEAPIPKHTADRRLDAEQAQASAANSSAVAELKNELHTQAAANKSLQAELAAAKQDADTMRQHRNKLFKRFKQLEQRLEAAQQAQGDGGAAGVGSPSAAAAAGGEDADDDA